MDYNAVAKEVVKHIGGKSNIVSAAHCATRLRLVIADNAKCDKEAVENIDGVKGVFIAAGQLQIIFGTGTVNKVYDEFVKAADITEASKEEVKQAANAKQNIFKRMIKTLGDIFVPIIPAIVASGLLMGLLEGLSKVYPELLNSGTYTILHLFSNAAFVFLPVLIAVSAAKTFGGNLFLGAVIGMIMIHPDLLNAWNVAGADTIPTAGVWFGLYDINMVGYQGHVIPVVIAVWFMSTIEKKLHKIVPEIIDLFVTPLVTVLVTGYLTLTVFGPCFSWVENGVLDAVKYLITIPFGIGAAICGAFYAPTVVAGVHHMYNAVEAGLISSEGVNTWMPIATAANVAQGAAALALALKTRNKKTKALALPASLSAFLGITEPAIFGVNIRYMKPFIAGCIGGACGALVAGITGIGASAYGVTGVFGFLITTNYTLQYLLVMVVASVVAFVISWMLYKDKETVSEVKPVEEKEALVVEKNTIYAPIEGEVIALNKVPDDTFAGEILGKGCAIIPKVGRVVAPFDGVVETVFDTKHAIGLKSADGVEVLIHIGINTVELDGKYYETYVNDGDTVKAGDLLGSFDIEKIKEAGYEMATPIVITNTDDYSNVNVLFEGETQELQKVMMVE
ncbi:MAG: sucrose-specific PTS transporter subunit IIBC [bacterium]|nr:sucrose-specific PTS transporter subunit IIBC [bacterium]